MRRVLPLFLALFFLLSGCTPAAPQGDRADFDSFCAQVNARRAENLTWTEEESAALDGWEAAFSGGAGGLTDAECKTLVTPREETSRVTAKEAREDVEIFFRALKAAYGGYAYFGGDEVFEAAKEEVLAGLPQSSLSASKLSGRLRDALAPVIQDGHFSINGHTFIGDYKQYMYYVPGLWFDDLTGLDMDYVKPTIGPDGALTYCFAAESRGLPQTAVVEGKETALDWTRAGLYQTEGRERVVYRRTSRGGVAVLESRTLAAGADEEIQ